MTAPASPKKFPERAHLEETLASTARALNLRYERVAGVSLHQSRQPVVVAVNICARLFCARKHFCCHFSSVNDHVPVSVMSVKRLDSDCKVKPERAVFEIVLIISRLCASCVLSICSPTRRIIIMNLCPAERPEQSSVACDTAGSLAHIPTSFGSLRVEDR